VDSTKSTIKLIDFGLAASYAEGPLMGTIGTKKYMAPEVLSGDEAYDNSADLWSLGVLLFKMLSKTLPFECDDDTLMVYYEWKSKRWTKVSQIAKDFIYNLLLPQEFRITIERALHHPWINEISKYSEA